MKIDEVCYRIEQIELELRLKELESVDSDTMAAGLVDADTPDEDIDLIVMLIDAGLMPDEVRTYLRVREREAS